MRLLDRYLIRELLIPLGYCLAGFMVFWISFDLFSELDDFQQRQLGWADIAEYYVVRAPELLVTVMPIALLLGALYALTNHARHQELTAMRAAGVSIWRLSAPYFAVGLLFSAGLFLLNELWVPDSAEAAERIRNRGQSGAETANSRWRHNLHFRNARDGRIWAIGAVHLDTFALKNPQIEWNLPDGTSRRLIARSAIRTNDVWTFYDVQEIIYQASADQEPETPRPVAVLPMPEFSETPEQILSEIKISQLSGIKAAKKVQLSLREILDYLRLHPSLNQRDEALLKTQLHARLAAPWTCLVVVLIAIPFGAPSARRNVFVGVASSIFICFSFFILLRFGLALGTGAYLPPWLAAWAPNLVFGAAGLWMTQRVR